MGPRSLSLSCKHSSVRTIASLRWPRLFQVMARLCVIWTEAACVSARICRRDSIALVLCPLPWTIFSCRLSFRPWSQFSVAVPLAAVQMLAADGDLPRKQVRRGFRQSGRLDYRLLPARPRVKDQEATDSHATIYSHHIMLNTAALDLSRAILLSFRLLERRDWCTGIFKNPTLSRCSLRKNCLFPCQP